MIDIVFKRMNLNHSNNKRSRFVDLCINSMKSSKMYVHIMSAKWNHSNSLIEVAKKFKKEIIDKKNL